MLRHDEAVTVETIKCRLVNAEMNGKFHAEDTAHEKLIVFPLDTDPYGLSYKNWTVKWWQWILALPKSVNPAIDTTGEYCMKNQIEPQVIFLAGTLGGSARRRCSIPAKGIFLPIINDEQSFLERPEVKSEIDLKSLVAREMDGVSEMYVTIDNVSIPILGRHRIQTEVFDVTLPEDNIWGVKAGRTRAAADGYWIFLRPFSDGEHVIHFSAKGLNFKNDVLYHLRVDEA